jgi:hypothetical protein
MRMWALISGVLAVLYGVDAAFSHGHHARVISQMVADIKHHMLSR